MGQSKYLLFLLFFLLNVGASEEPLANYQQDFRFGYEENLRKELLFLDQSSDFCSHRLRILKTSFLAAQRSFYQTSEALLIKLLNCNSKDLTAYKELLKVYLINSEDLEFDSLMKVAKNELSKVDFDRLQFAASKSFSSNFFTYQYWVSPIYSSNINNGIDSDFIKVFGLPFEVSEDDKPISSLGINYSLNFSYFFSRTETSGRFNFATDIKDYPNIDGDREFYYVSYMNNSGFDGVSFNLGKSYLAFQGSKISHSDVFSIRLFNKIKYFETVMVGIKKENYKADYMTGISKNLFLKTSLIFDDDSVTLENYKAKKDTFSYNKILLDTGDISLFGLKDLNFFLSQARYQEQQSIFDERRLDNGIGLYFNFDSFLQNNRIQLKFYKVSSNINLYDTFNFSFNILN